MRYTVTKRLAKKLGNLIAENDGLDIIFFSITADVSGMTRDTWQGLPDSQST